MVIVLKDKLARSTLSSKKILKKYTNKLAFIINYTSKNDHIKN